MVDVTPEWVSAFLKDYAVDPWAHGDFARLDARLDPAFVLQPDDVTADGLKELITEFRAGLPDLSYTIEETIADGDKIAFSWTMSGTHLGQLEGLAPTGKPVVYTGITILHLKDGLLVDDRYESGSPSLAQQVLAPSDPDPRG